MIAIPFHTGHSRGHGSIWDATAQDGYRERVFIKSVAYSILTRPKFS